LTWAGRECKLAGLGGAGEAKDRMEGRAVAEREPGIKVKVKRGVITAEEGIRELEEKAGTPLAVDRVRRTNTYRWLAKRVVSKRAVSTRGGGKP